MRPLGSRISHYWKLQNMMRVTGADAAAAFAAGDLSPETWADMVDTCRGCAWTGGCARYLARMRLNGERRDAPVGCLNRGSLSALRKTYPEVAQ